MKIYYIMVLTIFATMLGCSNQNSIESLSIQDNNIEILENVEKIEVIKIGDEKSPTLEEYLNNPGKVVNVIEDTKTIYSLIEDLKDVKSISVDSDIALPNYKILFIHKDEVILELGYYAEKTNEKWGVFLDYYKEQLYNTDFDIDFLLPEFSDEDV